MPLYIACGKPMYIAWGVSLYFTLEMLLCIPRGTSVLEGCCYSLPEGGRHTHLRGVVMQCPRDVIARKCCYALPEGRCYTLPEESRYTILEECRCLRMSLCIAWKTLFYITWEVYVIQFLLRCWDVVLSFAWCLKNWSSWNRIWYG
jgi:hypothetical protein